MTLSPFLCLIFIFFCFKFILFQECLQYFVAKNVNLNAKDDKGYSALHYTALMNNYKATELLIQYPTINLQV